jgi:hypothetical protein
MTDPEGQRLTPPRINDQLRHKAVWAVYKFRGGLLRAEARNSEFLALAAAKAMADALNSSRAGGEGYYFKACRVVPSLAPGAEPQGSPSPDK